MAIKECKVMTPELREQFVKKGWVKIEAAVPLDKIKQFSDDVWVRLGYDPQDKSTWEKESIHMPRHREVAMKEFSPKGWAAICEILGGEDRIDPTLFESFGDSLICNLGSPEWENKETIDPRLLGNWHIDGDWFTHFLDSGEQALTVIVLFNDIIPRAGGTFLAPDGLKNVVKCYQTIVGCTNTQKEQTVGKSTRQPHSASKNYLRIPRFITNPPVTLGQPLCFTRENSKDYSLTELAVIRALHELGASEDEIKTWSIKGKRRRFTPRTRAGKDAMIVAEVERMKVHELQTGGAYKVDSMHINGPVPYQTVIPMEGY